MSMFVVRSVPPTGAFGTREACDRLVTSRRNYIPFDVVKADAGVEQDGAIPQVVFSLRRHFIKKNQVPISYDSATMFLSATPNTAL